MKHNDGTNPLLRSLRMLCGVVCVVVLVISSVLGNERLAAVALVILSAWGIVAVIRRLERNSVARLEQQKNNRRTTEEQQETRQRPQVDKPRGQANGGGGATGIEQPKGRARGKAINRVAWRW